MSNLPPDTEYSDTAYVQLMAEEQAKGKLFIAHADWHVLALLQALAMNGVTDVNAALCPEVDQIIDKMKEVAADPLDPTKTIAGAGYKYLLQAALRVASGLRDIAHRKYDPAWTKSIDDPIII